MKRGMSWVVALTLISVFVLMPSLLAQIKQDPKTKLDSIEGYVQSMDKKIMTIVVREKGTANLDYKVIYNEKTTFTYRNAAATIDEVKDGRRVVCIGKADGATKLNADRIDVRDK